MTPTPKPSTVHSAQSAMLTIFLILVAAYSQRMEYTGCGRNVSVRIASRPEARKE